MSILDAPFTAIRWDDVPAVEHRAGEGGSGTAWWRTVNAGNVRVRLVEYSPGYASDHWCDKGHVVHVLRGEIHTTLADGRTITSRTGDTWLAGDAQSRHRSAAPAGATLLIVD